MKNIYVSAEEKRRRSDWSAIPELPNFNYEFHTRGRIIHHNGVKIL